MRQISALKEAATTITTLKIFDPFRTYKVQAWRGRKRQARGHHSPPCIQGEWLTIDDQKNNILASLCLASYLAANWLQKLEAKHYLLRRSYFCSCACVCVCVCGISV